MMNHTMRVLKRIFDEIERYKRQELDEKKLIKKLEPHISVLDDGDIKDRLEKFIINIEESLYLFDVEPGKEFLLKKLRH